MNMSHEYVNTLSINKVEGIKKDDGCHVSSYFGFPLSFFVEKTNQTIEERGKDERGKDEGRKRQREGERKRERERKYGKEKGSGSFGHTREGKSFFYPEYHDYYLEEKQ